MISQKPIIKHDREFTMSPGNSIILGSKGDRSKGHKNIAGMGHGTPVSDG